MSDFWQELSDRVGGQVIPGETFLHGAKVTKQHSVWTIQLDLIVGHRLQGYAPKIRVRAPYITTDKFQFKVCKKDLFSSLVKIFGMPSIHTGFSEFDRGYLVQANDTNKANDLFNSQQLRQYVSQHKTADFWLKVRTSLSRGYHMPSGVYMLQYQSLGNPRKFANIEYLSQLFALFTETLDHLHVIGSAEERTPARFYYD